MIKLSKQDMRYFNIAKSISYVSNYPRIHIGAVLVNNKDIVSSSPNIMKSHPIQASFNKFREFGKDDKCQNYLHAELRCILKAKDIDLSDAELYIYRESSDGNLRNCRPCNACMMKIKESGIKHIYYTTNHGYVYEYIGDR